MIEEVINCQNADDFFKNLSLSKTPHRLIDICVVDNLKRKNSDGDIHKESKRFECVYHFICLDSFERLFVKIYLNKNEQIPNIEKYWNISNILQKEIYDLFGIETSRFNFDKEDRIYTRRLMTGHPLLKDFDEKKLISKKVSPPVEKKEDLLTIDCQELKLLNPIQQGNHEILLEIDEGVIQEAFVFLGKKHLGIEKIFEKRPFNQIINLAGKLNPYSSVNHNLVCAKAIEQFFEIEIPEKAQAVRMILSELTRIGEHLICLGSVSLELSAIELYDLCIDTREYIYQLIEKFDKGRVQLDLICIGGMTTDIPIGWQLECLNCVKVLQSRLKNISNKVSNVCKYNKNLGVLTAEEAVSFSYSGPILRSTGINYDIRKRFPYYFYDQIHFEIPLGSNGTCLDRNMVRVEEINQSLKIIIQLIDGIPPGNFLSDFDNDFKKSGQHYSCIESSNGELGLYLVNDNDSAPYRFHLVPPNLGFVGSFKNIIKGLDFENAGASYSSLNIISSELER